MQAIGSALLVDIATFLFTMGTLLLVRLPAVIEAPGDKPNLRREMQLGLSVIRGDRDLLGSLVICTAINFSASLRHVEKTTPAAVPRRTSVPIQT